MRWSEFNDDMTEWTLPAERSKNELKRALPVTRMMADIIKTILRVEGQDGLRDNLFGRKFTSWAFGKERVDEKVRLPA
jgi:integrase